MEKNKKQVCCICGKEFEGYGNNPEPVKSEGLCCDQCNLAVVLVARINKLEASAPRVGDRIHIINMDGEPEYKDREGVITHIDSIGQLHGTWGGCGILQDIDEFFILK